jgi:hypothetical protein
MLDLNDDIFTPAPLSPAIDGGKQSKVGIASFVVGLFGIIVFCIAILISIWYFISISQTDPTAIQDPWQIISQASSGLIIILGILSWCPPILNLVGLGLGIVAVIQKKDRKTFGAIGLLISVIFLLVFCILLVYSLSMGNLAGLYTSCPDVINRGSWFFS